MAHHPQYFGLACPVNNRWTGSTGGDGFENGGRVSAPHTEEGSDLMTKNRKVQLTPHQQYSYQMKVEKEGYQGSPADFLVEQAAINQALVERLERQENDPVLRNVCQIASQLDEMRVAHDELRAWLRDELRDLRQDMNHLRQDIRDGQQQPGITKRPRYYPDDDGGDFGFPGA